MNLKKASGQLRKFAFRLTRAVIGVTPGGVIDAFGTGKNKIGAVMVINLDRQTSRWQLMKKELGRFRTADGVLLSGITSRFAAIDARDGRAVAATADVDPNYCIGDQLFVQPDPFLSASFAPDHPVRMTRQETAVARSHIEVWKAIVDGPHEYVLVLEDDTWFRPGAAALINRGWNEALHRCGVEGPCLLYLSYDDAGGSAERTEVCDELFRPERGLWFLSGYVLSREGAARLLRAMPVVGPVDMWINYKFGALGALALSSPAILQRSDATSDNAYSIMPFLARAGIIDAGSGAMSPPRTHGGPVLAWGSGADREGLPMAISMLGLRVRAFDGTEQPLDMSQIRRLFKTFDVLVDAPLTHCARKSILSAEEIQLVVEGDVNQACPIDLKDYPESRFIILSDELESGSPWEPLCKLFGVPEPTDSFPMGAPKGSRLFRDDRLPSVQVPDLANSQATVLDDSPWVLPPGAGWIPNRATCLPPPSTGDRIVYEAMTSASSEIQSVAETFPGNQAVFARDSVTYDERGACLRISEKTSGKRLYQSGALASCQSFSYGHFEAEIKAATGAGLVTGFFLHRAGPRQEIDIELLGNDPWRMITNVYFNPGDEGAEMGFGYRGTPHFVDLSFDSTLDYHLYAIDWQPGRVTWLVDGEIVHERLGWDPTPIPHLPMRLHANLWSPKSEKLAGRVDETKLPSFAIFRNISIRNQLEP
jgi:GR25 family glycosyltransferase involved in LPS biosynthesis